MKILVNNEKIIFKKNFEQNELKEYNLVLSAKKSSVKIGKNDLEIDKPLEFFKYVVKYLENTNVDVIIKDESEKYELFASNNDYKDVLEAICILPTLYNSKEENKTLVYKNKLN